MTELLERQEALAKLNAAFAVAGRGAGGIALVSGEAGIGKTTLVRAFAAALGDARVLWGGCEALFSPRPLGPLYDIAPQLPAPIGRLLGQDGRRTELFAALLAELCSRRAPTVVVIEDAHWADAATLDFIKFLGRRVHQGSLLLVLTYRDDELSERHPLRLVLGDFPSANVTRVGLLPLSEAAVAALARQSAHSAAGVYAVTGGNPFFVTELLNADGLPATVRDAVLARAVRQAPDVRALLDLASLVPARIEYALVERLLASNDDTIAAALASGLLRAEGDGFTFRHELARIALEQALPAPRRRDLHARIFVLLEQGDAGPVTHARLVHHATQSGASAAVLRYAPLAAAEAAAHGAHREAAALYALALEHAGAEPPAVRIALLEGRAYQCYLTDQIGEAIAARQALLAIYRAAGDALQEGTTLRWLSRLAWFAGDNAAAEHNADAAVALLSTLPAGPALAWALSNRAQLHMLADRHEPAVAWGERAIALAQQLHDDEVLAHALNNVGAAQYRRGMVMGRDALERSLALALAHRYDEHVARAYANLGSNAVTIRDYATAQRYFEEAAAYFAARDLDSWSNYVLAWRARSDFECGRWEPAEEAAGRLLARPASAIIRIGALAVLARLRARRGDSGADALLAEALPLAERTAEVQRLGPVLAALAEVAWLRGQSLTPLLLLQQTYSLAVANDDARFAGELGYWMWKGGALVVPAACAELPYAVQVEGQWREAASRWAALGCPFEQAMALVEGNEAAMRQALAIFERLGATTAATMCRERLREAGARRVPRGPRASTLGNPSGLTTRELEVLKLLVKGLPNAEIALCLVRSEKTVDHHVSAILAKLSVRSRTEAVIAAHRLGLVDGR